MKQIIIKINLTCQKSKTKCIKQQKMFLTRKIKNNKNKKIKS